MMVVSGSQKNIEHGDKMNRQQEILNILQEECAEVVQAVSKIHRFGLNSENPYTNTSNQIQLEKEIGDLMCMIELASKEGMIDSDRIAQAKEEKYQKLKTWMVNK